MDSLLGDRFLKRFAGEIRRKQRALTPKTEGHKPDSDEQTVVRPDNNAEEEAHENEVDSQGTRQGSTANTSEVDDG